MLPAVKKRQPVMVEAGLSEPPEMRAQIEKRGAGRADQGRRGRRRHAVTVLSAYKQGYSWLYDVDAPRDCWQADREHHHPFRRDRAAARVEAAGDVLADAMAARDVSHRRSPGSRSEDRLEADPVREGANRRAGVRGDRDRARAARRSSKQTFEPKFVLRDFFDQFPAYEKVRVDDRLAASDVWRRACVGPADRDRCRALLGSLPGEDAARHVRLR